MRSPNVYVDVNLDTVRAAAESIRTRTGVKLIAVIKADAYGLGAPRVADALASVADDFAYFAPHEARAVGRPGLVLGPADGDPADYRELDLRPSVTSVAEAERFKGLPVAIKVDAGTQRFGCSAADLDPLIARCNVTEFWAHAITIEAAERLKTICAGRGRPVHAAATDLLPHPPCHLDAVRPGLALYRGAVRVTARLHSVRDTSGPLGYSGFTCPRVGVFLAGYSNSVSPGPVLINGRRQQILESGMNTSLVSVDPQDQAGDEVILLGDALDEKTLAAHFRVRPHEILCRYTSMGQRRYWTNGTLHT